jgi:hypothetical protein
LSTSQKPTRFFKSFETDAPVEKQENEVVWGRDSHHALLAKFSLWSIIKKDPMQTK